MWEGEDARRERRSKVLRERGGGNKVNSRKKIV